MPLPFYFICTAHTVVFWCFFVLKNALGGSIMLFSYSQKKTPHITKQNKTKHKESPSWQQNMTFSKRIFETLVSLEKLFLFHAHLKTMPIMRSLNITCDCLFMFNEIMELITQHKISHTSVSLLLLFCHSSAQSSDPSWFVFHTKSAYSVWWKKKKFSQLPVIVDLWKDPNYKHSKVFDKVFESVQSFCKWVAFCAAFLFNFSGHSSVTPFISTFLSRRHTDQSWQKHALSVLYCNKFPNSQFVGILRNITGHKWPKPFTTQYSPCWTINKQQEIYQRSITVPWLVQGYKSS